MRFLTGRPRQAGERHLASLHLGDLALATACADGHEAAWEHFGLASIGRFSIAPRDAIDKTGGAREGADSLYASCSV
jgi:hypothetical protein